MEVRRQQKQGMVILEPVGRLDTKTSHEFEKEVVEHLEGGERRFVIDFTEIEYISSAGLRVLLMLGKKLSGMEGDLILCALNESVEEVFEVAGFSSIFTIHESQTSAIAALGKAPKNTTISDVAARLLLGSDRARREPQRAATPDEAAIRVSSRAAELLGVSAAPRSRDRAPAAPDSPAPDAAPAAPRPASSQPSPLSHPSEEKESFFGKLMKMFRR